MSSENLLPQPSKYENKLARNTKRWSKGCKGKVPHSRYYTSTYISSKWHAPAILPLSHRERALEIGWAPEMIKTWCQTQKTYYNRIRPYQYSWLYYVQSINATRRNSSQSTVWAIVTVDNYYGANCWGRSRKTRDMENQLESCWESTWCALITV
jgi:hypothetical protein